MKYIQMVLIILLSSLATNMGNGLLASQAKTPSQELSFSSLALKLLQPSFSSANPEVGGLYLVDQTVTKSSEWPWLIHPYAPGLWEPSFIKGKFPLGDNFLALAEPADSLFPNVTDDNVLMAFTQLSTYGGSCSRLSSCSSGCNRCSDSCQSDSCSNSCHSGCGQGTSCCQKDSCSASADNSDSCGADSTCGNDTCADECCDCCCCEEGDWGGLLGTGYFGYGGGVGGGGFWGGGGGGSGSSNNNTPPTPPTPPPVPVPEPATYLLLGAMVTAAVYLKRRRERVRVSYSSSLKR